jgi:multiple sugar transport system ATP-binding protein
VTAAIEISNVVKRFGALTVIDHLSLAIKPNEFMVFLGPSGCGKSTLLRMIAGLESVDEGTISVNGVRIDNLPPGQRDIAMVFQSYALYPHMTVADNMAFGLRNIGMAEDVIKGRIVEAARMLEITPLLERKPGQLSGGQRQRVAIGRAIVKEPKAFLFDEPLSNLDAALRVRTRVELAQLHHRVNSTMIFVTHDQIEAMTMADRIVVLNAARIEQIGSPMEIYTRPASRFVAGFVGSPTMNFLPAEVSGKGPAGLTLTFAAGASLETAIDPASYAEKAATLGIRAEQIKVGAPGAGTVDGRIEVIERLGDRTLAYVRIGDGEVVTAEAPGNSRIAVGEAVSLALVGSEAHIFDAAGRAFHGREVAP